MIEIIAGKFGHNVNGRIMPITPEDGPHELGRTLEDKLVELGIANRLEIDPNDMTVAELKAELDELGVSYKTSDKRDDLIALLIAARKGESADSDSNNGDAQVQGDDAQADNADGDQGGEPDGDQSGEPDGEGQVDEGAEEPPTIDAQTAE